MEMAQSITLEMGVHVHDRRLPLHSGFIVCNSNVTIYHLTS